MAQQTDVANEVCLNVALVRQKMHGLKLDEKGLAQAIGVSAQSLFGWLGGRNVPKAQALWDLAALFGCSVQDRRNPRRSLLLEKGAGTDGD